MRFSSSLPARPFSLPTKRRYSPVSISDRAEESRQVPDALLDLEGLLEDVEACDRSCACRRREKAGEDAHRRCLPGAVGPEKSNDLAFGYGERNVVDGDRAAYLFVTSLTMIIASKGFDGVFDQW